MIYYQKYKKYLFILLLFFIIILLLIGFKSFKKKNINKEISLLTTDKMSTKIITNTFFVDVKGAVKNPGVYEFVTDDKVIDAINRAGGLNKYATTININLSQKLKDQMVVYVFTKSEITTTKEKTTIPIACHCETFSNETCITKNTTTKVTDNVQNSNTKVNINTADINTLMTLSSIGESKAKAIISYREINGNFTKIDDIKNVTGIGDSIYNQIKENITV